MRRLRDLLVTRDRVKYLAWKAGRIRRPATFRLRSGERIYLRAAPATDVLTAYEMFVAEVYRDVGPEPNPAVKRVVDVGANVGLSLVYWANRYPKAALVAFEPHPVHLASLRRNLEINGIADRVQVHAAAACTAPGTAHLSDEENCSAVVDGKTTGAQRVEAVDFFASIGIEPIDLLKIDIEGGEYALLEDARFAALRVSRLVLEWHKTDEHPEGRQWCERQLESMGYTVVPGKWSSEQNGLLWGFRRPDSQTPEKIS